MKILKVQGRSDYLKNNLIVQNMRNMKVLVISTILFYCIQLNAQNITREVENRAEAILQKMTLDEKIDYISGYNDFYIRSIPRLGVPEVRMADGPQGIRNETKSTMFPCGILSASTWNRSLINKLGEALGQDARARGIHILLGPGVNIYRAPMCGRNFEYFGEDPYLAGETAVQYIKGVQSQGVISTVKHFAGNNQEWDRHHVSTDIDDRTLHEIYLPAFEKAVKEANVGAVMNSYNLLNSVHSSENQNLNISILRKQWGFKGILMSDWNSVYSGIEAANGGLDLEMPNGLFMNKGILLPAIENGLVEIKTIDEKVRRILQTIIAYGFLDHNQLNKSIPKNNPFSNEIALELAREGVVLLKNESHILPLTQKNILVMGPNAKKIPTGGGSGFVDPFSSISVLDAMRDISSKKINIDTIPVSDFTINDEVFVKSGSNEKGLWTQYFKNKTHSGKPDYETIESGISHDWGLNAPLEGFPTDSFSVQWVGVYRPQKSGIVEFIMTGDDGYCLFLDEKLIIWDWRDKGKTTKTTSMFVEAGKEYKIRAVYYDNNDNALVKLEYKFISENTMKSKLEKAQSVIVCVGFDSDTEVENADRTFALPQFQQQYIDFVTKYHNNVIVVINAGGGVDVSTWENKVKAIMMAWYPGQQGGVAIAEILTGELSPSGKLPISIEKKWEDNPAYNSYYDNRNIPLRRVQYSEGVFIGYRGYDKSKIKPQYPFGYGLSYSEFRYSNLKLEKLDGYNIKVSFDVKNIGKYDASEIAQLYVSDLKSSVPRPEKELKGYEKMFLKKGEKKTINIMLNERSFAFYNTEIQKFVVESGTYNILIGSSSASILLQDQVSF